MGPWALFWGGIGGDDAVDKTVKSMPKSIKSSRRADEALGRFITGGLKANDLLESVDQNLKALQEVLEPAAPLVSSTAVYGTGLFMLMDDTGPRELQRSVQSMFSKAMGVEDRSRAGDLGDLKAALVSSVNGGVVQHYTVKGRLSDRIGLTQSVDINLLIVAHQKQLDEFYKTNGRSVTKDEYNTLLSGVISKFTEEYGKQVGFEVHEGVHYYVLGEDQASHRTRPLTGLIGKAYLKTQGVDPDALKLPDSKSAYEHLSIHDVITKSEMLSKWRKDHPEFGKLPLTSETVEMIMTDHFNGKGRGTALVDDKGQVQVFMLPVKKVYLREDLRPVDRMVDEVRDPNKDQDALPSEEQQSAAEQLAKFLKKDGAKVAGLGALLITAGFMLPEGVVIGVVGSGLTAGGLFGSNLLQSMGGVRV